MSIYEYPPILTGSSYRQLEALRDYLVRMVESLEKAHEQTSQALRAQAEEKSPETKESPGPSAPDNATALRSLIVKTAGSIRQNVEQLSNTLREDYLALSDFGTYTEELKAQFTATARAVVEQFSFESRLDYAQQQYELLESHVQTLQGQIRRGIITDPDTGENCFGIAIAQSLSFTGNVLEEGGLTWYELSPGQTLGLYTATGWQFWINGSKRGWFDSADGMLHIRSITVEEHMELGSDWLLSHPGGFGIRYTG